MEEKEIFKEVGQAVTGKPISITIDVSPPSRFYALMQRIGVFPKQKVFEVKPITLGNLLRISELLTGIDENIIETIKKGFESSAKHLPALIEAVAIGLHNQKTEPPKWLVEFIKYNMTACEMADVLSVVLKQLNVQDFIKSIALIRGLNVLDQASRNQQGS